MFEVELKPLLTDQEIEELIERENAMLAEHEPRRGLPEGLELIPPGPLLAAALATIDDRALNGHELVKVLKARARQRAHEDAGYYRTMAGVTTAVPTGEEGEALRQDEWYEHTNMEVRAALAMTRRAADSELGLSYELRERLPKVWEALHRGEIDIRRAREIVNGVSHVPVDEARAVSERIIPDAPGLTTGQIRARLRRLCLETNPEDAQERLQSGLNERTLYASDNPEGTSNLLGLHLEPHRVRKATKRINGIARKLKKNDEDRTYDQIRADVFLDLLTGDVSTAGEGGVVDIRVDLKTLAEMDESPGDLAGYGPVVADIARQVADSQQRSEWPTTVTDDHGNILHSGTTRRRPDTELRRRVEATYPRCTFPGCRMPATECDIDHIDPWIQSGQTDFGNLAPLCRRDHVGRHEAGWTYQRLPDGRHEWTSRLGHKYLTDGRPP